MESRSERGRFPGWPDTESAQSPRCSGSGRIRSSTPPGTSRPAPSWRDRPRYPVRRGGRASRLLVQRRGGGPGGGGGGGASGGGRPRGDEWMATEAGDGPALVSTSTVTKYDAFLSYTHRDSAVAVPLQRQLERRTKPWWRPG